MENIKKKHHPRCEHNVNKYQCTRCKGGFVCPHGRIRVQCKDCGSQICIHGKKKDEEKYGFRLYGGFRCYIFILLNVVIKN